jgi:tape measure domain-containing protein
MGEGGKILVPASIVPAITNADVATFKKAVAEKLSGIKVEVGVQAGKFSSTGTGAAGLHEYMRSQGMSGGNMPGAASVGRSERLRKALEEQTVKQLNELAKGQGLSGYSKLKKDPLINKLIAELGNDAAEALLGNIKMQMGNAGKSPIKRSFLDQIARAVFFMAGVDPSQLRAQPRKLPEVNWPTTAVPRQRPPIGPSSTGRLLGAAAGPAGLISGNTGPFGFLPRTTAKGSLQDAMRMLPEKQAFAGGPGALALSAEKLKSRVDTILREYFRTIAVQVSEAFDSPAQLKKQLNVFSYLAQSLKEAEQRTKENKVKEAVASLINALEGMAKDATFQARAARIRTTRIFDLGSVQQRMLPPQRIAGMLPAGVGRESQRYATGATGGESRQAMTARRTAEAYARSAFRGMTTTDHFTQQKRLPGTVFAGDEFTTGGGRDRVRGVGQPPARGGAIVPYAAPAQPPTATRSRGGLNIPNLPGTGLVQELGTEFAFAAKQVLLFGTAYKALAFLTGFPQQVGDAVGALQTFRNTLNTISPSAGEAAASSQFILDIVDKYNVPLQSARDGFTKLYASMQPAGFSGNEIRDLFLGISQSAATFGMSADKVDRVNYAFAQMASKGQVMSEELKGQLGDVLPGAMAIFAEAAGFKGPEAIKTFSKALEDGAYKGGAMKALLLNVGTIMRKEFGPGAEGAARTFQGSMNRMQNSLKFLYESFEPVAIGFVNSVVVPMTKGIKTVADGFNAFFSGAAAQSSSGAIFAQQLEALRPTFEGIRSNLVAMQPVLQAFGGVLLEVSKVFLQIAGNPFVGYLARVYLNVLALTTVINILNLRALIPFIANLARSAFALVAFSAQMVGANQGLQLLNLTTRTAGATLRTFFATTGVGLVLVGIGLLIERFMSMNQKLEETRQKALGAADAIRSMSGIEARAAGQQAQTAYSLIGNIAGRQSPAFSGVEGGGDRLVPITAKELEQLSKLGAIKTQEGAGGLLAKRSDILTLAPQAQRLKAEADYREKQSRLEEQQSQASTNLTPIPPGEGDASAAQKAAEKAQRDAEKLAS